MEEHHPDQPQKLTDTIKTKGLSTSQIITLVTLLPIGGVLLSLSGLTLSGTLVSLAVATPVFIIFIPVLVPAALTVALAVTGFSTSVAFGIASLSSVSWLFNYMRRKREISPEHLDHTKRQALDTAETTYLPPPPYPEHHHDQPQRAIDIIKQKAPSTSQVLAVATLLPTGGALLCLSGLILAVTLVILVVATPLFVICSPVLVPAVITIALAVIGFLTSGVFGITGLTSIGWIVKNIRRRGGGAPPLPEHLEHVKLEAVDMGGDMGEKVEEGGRKIEESAKT